MTVASSQKIADGKAKWWCKARINAAELFYLRVTLSHSFIRFEVTGRHTESFEMGCGKSSGSLLWPKKSLSGNFYSTK